MSQSNECQACCDALDCRQDASETNIVQLFQRTEDLKTAIGSGFFRIINNETDLIAALAESVSERHLIYNGEIELSQTHNLPSGTSIWFGSTSFPHVDSADHTAYKIVGSNVRFYQHTINMHHPNVARIVAAYAAASTWDKSTCIFLSETNDCSGFSVTDCDFLNTYCGIRRWEWGGSFKTTAPYSDFCIVDNCRFKGFGGIAIYVRGRMRHFTIKNSFLSGWNVNEATPRTTDTMHFNGNGAGGNAVWVGEQCDFFHFTNNDVTQVDRHGVEYWNSTVAGGNKDPLITNNRLRQIRSFAISAFGAGIVTINKNVFRDIGVIAIETFMDANNTGIPHVTDNDIDRVIYPRSIDPASGSVITIPSAVAISINSVKKGIYRGNIIGLVSSRIPGIANSSNGIQLIESTTQYVRDITIADNEFIDSGAHMILVNSGSAARFYNLDFSNNTFRRTSDALLPTDASNVNITFTTAIWFIKCVGIAKNNKFFIKAGTASDNAGGKFRNNGDSIISPGDDSTADSTAAGDIGESNISQTHA